MANNSVRYPPELRERAVRMVLEATREGVYSSEWAAICAVAQMLGPTPETVRKWVRRQAAEASGWFSIRRWPPESRVWNLLRRVS